MQEAVLLPCQRAWETPGDLADLHTLPQRSWGGGGGHDAAAATRRPPCEQPASQGVLASEDRSPRPGPSLGGVHVVGLGGAQASSLPLTRAWGGRTGGKVWGLCGEDGGTQEGPRESGEGEAVSG